LERRLGARFADPGAALAALTHRSYVNEHLDEGREDNERLEFFGDSVLNLAVSHRLMERLPQAREGELSRLRAAIVDEEGLSNVARAIGLGELLLLGKGEERSGGADKPSLLADALEAVFAVLFLDGGLDAVLNVVDRLFGPALEQAARGALGRDFKSALQELTQYRFKGSPRYRLVSEEGPEHSKTFAVEVAVAGSPLGRGEGRSKKDAEQAAAREALAKLAAEADAGGAGSDKLDR
ncbi:MAG: ribonuclease III, partial [Myxococcales bacterium]|jgi:ribonuclease-3